MPGGWARGDGAPVNACLVLALEAPDATSSPSRGLARAGELHPIQQAPWSRRRHAVRLLHAGHRAARPRRCSPDPAPSEDEIRHAIAGNLCRCTGYDKIVEAIAGGARAAGRLRHEGSGQSDRRRSRWSASGLPRVDAGERVTGQAIYPADLSGPAW